MKRSAFTLIELLVVLAIISILAALLFPVFAKAREKARQTSCRSSLKQMVSALQMYTEDYDERLPGRFVGEEQFSWRALSLPYLKSTQLFQCPSHRSDKVVLDGVTQIPGNKAGQCVDGRFPPSYAVNGQDDQAKLGGPTPMPSDSGRALSEIVYPSDLILVAESNYPYSEIPGGFEPDLMYAGHTGMADFGFADGHVKSLKPTATVFPVNLWTIDESGASDVLIAFLDVAEKSYK